MELAERIPGPNTKYLQVQKPMRAATNYYNTVGDIYKKLPNGEIGAAAPETAMEMFRDGLKAIKDAYFKKQGGILYGKSGIHIKKANKGKFTDYCGGKVTQECIQRGKHSSNPAVRKRATFADNARH